MPGWSAPRISPRPLWSRRYPAKSPISPRLSSASVPAPPRPGRRPAVFVPHGARQSNEWSWKARAVRASRPSRSHAVGGSATAMCSWCRRRKEQAFPSAYRNCGSTGRGAACDHRVMPIGPARKSPAASARDVLPASPAGRRVRHRLFLAGISCGSKSASEQIDRTR